MSYSKLVGCCILFIISFGKCKNKAHAISNELESGKISSDSDDASIQYGFVVKLDVSDMERSVQWYVNNFSLKENKNYTTPDWVQFKIPGVTNAELGLKRRAGSGSGGVNLTFEVPDIKGFRDVLILKGVQVGPVKDVGQGVLLAFLKDPDSTTIVLRQEK